MKRILYAFLCIGAITLLPILLQAQPTANFSATPTMGCSPIVVQFTDLSTGGPTSWQWNLGNGTNSTLQNPSTTYITPGTYTVTLTATNASGSNTKTITDYITVLPAPSVNFTADDTVLCLSGTVQFTNTSAPGGTGTSSYYWDFGDGTNSTDTNPLHTYSTIGAYNVTLEVTNGNGCSKSITKTQYIQVVAKPTAGFSANNTSACKAPATITFTNSSAGAISYLWNFGDGGTSAVANPTHTYGTSGSFTVTLIATNAAGCSDTLVMPNYIVVNASQAAFTGPSSECLGIVAYFTNTSTPSGGISDWYFGDGSASADITNSGHAYGVAGTYTVTLVYNINGCIDTAKQTITAEPIPTASATADNYYNCSAPFTVNFTNTSAGATSYLWNFGDGNTSTQTSPSHTYTTTGNFAVTLTATNSFGCSAIYTLPNNIVIEPATGSISASPSTGCAPKTVSFSTGITNGVYGLNPTAANINFGDGSSANIVSGSHLYASPGTYTVTYSFTVAGGCAYTATTTVILGAPPVASFTETPDSVCVNQNADFTNTSTGATSYLWVFGDGATSGVTSPSHSYSNPGPYNVILVATNNYCSDTSVPTSVYVKDPLARFSTALTNCGNRYAFTFTNTSIGATSALWDFGDGSTSTSTASTVTHTYSAYGTYTVTLTVADSTTDCTNMMTKVVPVFPMVDTFNANHLTLCKGSAVTFTGTVNTGNHYQNYNWNFGDASSANYNTNTATHTYSTAGIYTVRLIIQDIWGCEDTLTKTNYIEVGGPTVSYVASPTTGCPGLTVGFTNNTNGYSFTPLSYAWVFGDGGTSTLTDPSHTYSTTGTFTSQLTATDILGCTGSASAVISVAVPTAQFTANDTAICFNGSVIFSNTSTGAVSYSWDFGDGTTSSAVSPSHSYTAPGYYTVTLVATNSYGCTNTMTRVAYIHVENFPVSFTLSDTLSTCPPLSVSVTGSSPADIATYAWTFGNGAQAVSPTPSTLYTYPGVYAVRLIATNSIGCVDSATQNVTVLGPTGTLSYSSVNGCFPVTVTLTANSQNTTSITWDMNNGYTQTTPDQATFTYTYTTPGSFVPLIVLNNGSCEVPIEGSDTIKVDGIYVDFTSSPGSICQGGTVNFTDTTYSPLSNVASWDWNFGDGSTGTGHNPTHTYTSAGTYTVQLIIANATGCHDTATNTVIVHAPPVVTAGTSQTICQGQATGVSLSASGASTYVWSPGTGLSCTACANPSALPTVTTTYLVTGTDVFGCTATANVTLSITPLPTVTATANPPAICSGTTATITGGGASNYTWSPATGLSCTDCASATAGPTTTTTYVVTGNNGTCSNTATVTVSVNPLPAISGGSNVSICQNTSTTLEATGGASYSWSPGTGLSCTGCGNPTASPLTTTTYTVTGTDSNGCHNTSTVTVTVNPLPTVTVTPAQTLCQGQTTPVTVTAGGATNYIWSPATGLSCTNCSSPNALPTVTTTYTVTGTDGNGCTNTASVTLQVLPLPTVTATANPPAICSGTTATITGSGASNYTWSPSTGLSCTDCASATASPTTTTTYVVTGNNGTCSNTATVTVNVNPLPAISGGSNVSICQNTSTTLEATGGASYSWSPGTGLSCTGCGNPTASPLTTTTYTVTGTDSNGCHNTSTVTVTVNPLPTVTVTPAQTLCQGQTTPVTVTAGGATNYIWSPATGLSCTNCPSPNALPAVTTTYTVTGTDGNGCTNTASVTLQVLPLPTVTATANPPAICSGTTATITGSGASNYTWSPATGLSCTDCASATAGPTTTTTYVVTGNNGTCSNTATVTVSVNPLPAISGGSNVSICQNTSTTLEATGGASYSWSPGTGLSCTGCGNPTASPLTTTTYTVTGTDSNGCHNTSTVTVTVNPLPTVTVTPAQTLCQGQTTPVTVTAGGATNYIWSPATGLSCTNCSSPNALPTVTTTYTVTGTDGNGCTNTASVTLQVLPLPTVTATANPPAICSGTTATITGGGASNYTWSPATGLSCTDCASATAGPTTTTTYVVTGNNGTCSNTATVTLTVNPLPTVNAGIDTALCTGSSVQLQATGTVNYTWSPVAGLSCTNCANPVANPTVTTQYIVTGTDANGCSRMDTMNVLVRQLPVITAAGQAMCPGGSVNLLVNGGASYVWSPAASLSCSTCPNPVADPAATTTYTITGTDTYGCASTNTVTVTVNPIPTVTATAANNTLCIGTHTNLQATGANNYTWSPATGLSCTNCSNPAASPTATITYTVTGANGTNCSNTATVTLTVNPLPTVNAGIDTALCTGSSVQLQATGTVNYTWSPVAGLSCTNCANPVANPTVTTQYIVTGTDANGCSRMDTMNVLVRQLPVITAAGQAMCPGGSVNLLVNGGASYVWSPAASLSCSTCPNPVADPAATTTYTITGTDTYGCASTNTVTVTVNPIPTVTATAANNTLCIGTHTNLQATGANNYTWSPATGLSCTNCSNPAASPTATITYTVTGANGTNCSNTATVTLTVNPLPTVNAGIDTALCTGSSVQLQATGTVNYTWSPVAGLSCTNCANPVANPTVTTQYIVTGTDANGCSRMDTMNVLVRQLPVITAAGQAMCPGGSVNLLVNGGASYVWSPAASLSCSTCPNPIADPAATTTYTITGTDTYGCVSTNTVMVTVNPIPTVTATAANNTLCIGTHTNLQATGANNYTWSPATGLSCTNCSNPAASPTATITYTVTGANGTNCSNTATVTVSVNPLPTVNAGIDTALCTGSSVQLQATGTVNYTWSPVAGLSCTNCANPVANPTVTTQYIVTGTNASGCSRKDTMNVLVRQLPVITAAGQAMCPGGSVNLLVNGGASYIWSPAASLSCSTCPNPIADPAATTTYTITGTDTYGCVSTSTVTVTVNPVPTVTATATSPKICIGTSTNIQAGGANNYTWSPATGLSCTNCTSPVASPSVTTTYTVTGANGTNCSGTATVTIVVNSLPVVNAGIDTGICAGMSVQLQVTGANTYVWSPVAGLSCSNCANPSASPSVNTSYVVTGTDTNSCVNHDTVNVAVYSLPIITAANHNLCIGATVQLLASGAGAYTWSPAAGLSCTDCSNPSANPVITTAYTITGVNGHGCIDSAHLTVTVDSLPVITTGPGQVICNGSSVQLHATGANTYLWSPSAGLSCNNCASPLASPSDTTTYMVTGTNGNGCTDTSAVTVNVLTKPLVSAGQDRSVCKGNSVELYATGAGTYAWSPSTGLSCANCDSTLVTPVSPVTYTVIGTGVDGCTDTAHVTVNVYTQPVISAGAGGEICEGSSDTLTGSGGQIYTWSPATGLSCTNCNITIASPSVTTTYMITGTDANGCMDSDRVVVMVMQPVATSVGPNDTICVGQSVQLSAGGGINFLWSPSQSLDNNTSANPYATPDTTTRYSVFIIENQCFTDTSYVTVLVNNNPTVTLGPDMSVIAGNSVPLVPKTTGMVTTYEWSPDATLSCSDCQSPLALPSVTTTYSVTVSTNAGCKASADITLNLGCDKGQVFIPNTFTPNGDGVNDRFYVSGKGVTTIKQFSVYDRWGELLFDAENIPVNDPQYGWDGTYKGKRLNPDVYVYIISATCETGELMRFKGDISIVR